MSDLEKVFDRVIDLLKGLKPGTVAGGRDMPSIKMSPATKITPPSTNKISGIKPGNQKNPVKQAQQIQNKDIKDNKMKEAQAALNAKPIDMNKEEDFPFKNAHTHEEKMKQMNAAYDKHKALHDKASDDASKKYHMGHLNRLQAKMQEHAKFKKSEEIVFNKCGQWSLK